MNAEEFRLRILRLHFGPDSALGGRRIAVRGLCLLIGSNGLEQLAELPL